MGLCIGPFGEPRGWALPITLVPLYAYAQAPMNVLGGGAFSCLPWDPTVLLCLQKYLTHKKQPPPRTLQ